MLKFSERHGCDLKFDGRKQGKPSINHQIHREQEWNLDEVTNQEARGRQPSS